MENNQTMKELWVTIEGFERYMVSSKGRVLNTKTGKYIGHTADSGYRVVSLFNNNEKKTF